MKKIIFIYTGSSAKGGLSTYYRNLFENYPKPNRVVLASFGSWSMPEELEKKGCEVVIFPRNFAGVREFYRYLRDEKINLIVTGGVLSNFIGRIAAGKIPVVTVVHSLFKTDYQRSLKRVVWDFINKIFKNQTVQYIAVSEFLKQNLISAGIRAEKITVIYNGIKTMEPVKEKQNDNFVIVSVGRLHRTKGFDRLIHAAKHLPEEFSVQIWGEGEERKSLEYLIERNNVAGKVKLYGASKDIESALRDADLYVQTSRMEGFGLAVVEAMMLRVPVAVTPRGALSEVVEDGKSGFVFSSEDPQRIASEIIEISQDKKKLAQIAKAGRDSARRRFEINAWTRALDNLLSEVAK